MTATGWTGGDAEGPATPVTDFLLGMRAERGPVDPLERARLARDAGDPFDPDGGDPFDPDERAANMLARGVVPGLTSDLQQRIREAEDLAKAEREKIAKYQRAEMRLRRMLDNGQVGAIEGLRGLPEPGSEHEAQRLERQAASLRRQFTEQQALIAPERQLAPDPLEAATRRAHDAFVSATRARFAEAQSGRPAPRGRVPFAYASRSDVPAEVTCPECIAVGADAEQSFAIHHDPELLALAGQDDEPSRSRRTGPYGYGDYGEITRVASADGNRQLGDVLGNIVR